MRFSIVSLGLVATMMMASSTFAENLSEGVGHTVGNVADRTGNSFPDGDSVQDSVGDASNSLIGDLFPHGISDVIVGNSFPPGIKGVLSSTSVVDEAAKAALSKAAVANKLATRSNFLARRKLGHAIHQRRATGDIGSTLDATTGTASQLKSKVATIAMAQVAKTEELANGAVKSNLARRSKGNSDEQDGDDEIDEDEDDEGSSGVARRSEHQESDENEVDENEPNENEKDENEVDENENEPDELGDAENDAASTTPSTGTIARRSEEEEDEDEGDEEEEDEEN